MFACLECGEIFSEPECWEERHNLDTPPYEEFAGCPYCQGTFVETERCDYCGEWINTEKYVQIDDNKYCWDCIMIKNLEDI